MPAKKALSAEPVPTPRAQRQQHLSDTRRQHILEAAKTIFQSRGLEGASLREIAKQAGYAPSALYFYYASKEAIYGDLLADSLERLNQAVTAAVKPSHAAERRFRDGALAFYAFYEREPRELELGFYLFQGMRPYGLSRELDARLNQRLLDALQPGTSALEELGWSKAKARLETAALFGHCVGLLVLRHTGRIKLFGADTAELFAEYLDRLIRSRLP